jgi:hypothetical protein
VSAAPELSPRDTAQLAAWWEHVLAAPDPLPPGVEPVHRRLVRAVGRGALADAGPVFVKVMGFPRWRDRVRYALRALPAPHEARLLAAAARAGIVVPRVLAARDSRRAGWPHRSMLVTAALAVDARPLDAAEVAAVAAALAAAGIDAPDLHPGNFLSLAGGGTAVLDLQSARLRVAPLGTGRRIRMASAILAELPGAADALAAAGLLPRELLGAALQAAAERRAAATRRRIRRCLEEGTEFSVERSLRGTTIRRRTTSHDGVWIEGGRELVRCWIGDRALEILDGTPPRLGTLFRKWWWFPGRHSVKISTPGPVGVQEWELQALVRGFDRYRALK